MLYRVVSNLGSWYDLEWPQTAWHGCKCPECTSRLKALENWLGFWQDFSPLLKPEEARVQRVMLDGAQGVGRQNRFAYD